MAGLAVLWRDGPVAVPLAYTVPQGGELLPLTVEATINGASAATEFYAVLQVIDPNGRSMGKYRSDAIAAGGSADVTWFPGAELEEESALATAYVENVLALGPWAFWMCADAVGSSTLADSSGHGRTLGLHLSTATLGQPGLIATSGNSCLLETLGGASNVEEAPSLNTQTFSASAVTLEYWINTAGNPGNEMILGCFDRFDAPHQTWCARLNGSGQPEFSFIDSGGTGHTFTFAAGLADSTTHQLVLVMDGTNVLCYTDGVLFGSQPAGASLNVPNTATVCLGQPLGGVVTRWYGGDIGPAVVYDKALTASEIAALYATATGTSSGGAVASVVAGDSSIVIGGTGTNPTIETGSIDVIAADHPTAADWSNNSHKITSVTDPTNAQDAATKNYVDTHGGGGAVSSVFTRTGAVVAVSGDYTLNQIGNATSDYSINSNKLTSVKDPTSAQDAATKNYVDTTLAGTAPWTTLTKPSDENRTSGSFAIDGTLQFATVNGAVYWVEVGIAYVSSVPVNFAVSLGEDATNRGALYYLGPNATGTVTLIATNAVNNGTLAAQGATTNRGFVLYGTLWGGGGTEGIWWASKTGGSQVTLKAGSFMRYQRIV